MANYRRVQSASTPDDVMRVCIQLAESLAQMFTTQASHAQNKVDRKKCTSRAGIARRVAFDLRNAAVMSKEFSVLLF